MAEIEALSYIIQGETGGLCGFMGALAVAWVFSRNDVMYGRQSPSDLAMLVARWWSYFPDPTRGATFLFSRQDLADERVQAIIRTRGSPKMIANCKAGLSLHAY